MCLGLAHQQQHGGGILRALPPRGLAHAWQTRSLQQRQGSEFTSDSFTGVLQREGITVSMDGHGRAYDNIFVERLWRSVKYEDVYLKGYASMGELLLGLTQYFAFYNQERPHQALGNSTPAQVYASGTGSGALIVDRYGPLQTPIPFTVALRCTATAFEENPRKEVTMQQNQSQNRGSAVQLRLKFSVA